MQNSRTENDLPSIEQLASEVLTSAIGLPGRVLIDGRADYLCRTTCPACGEPASKAIHQGRVVYVHSVLIRAGALVSASYHPAPAPRAAFC